MSTDRVYDIKWESCTPKDIDPTAFRTSFRMVSGVPYMAQSKGKCPRCFHDIVSIENLMELDMFTGGQLSSEVIRDIHDEAERQVKAHKLAHRGTYRCRVFCTCGQPHKGRPVNEREGCGASFVLVVAGPNAP
jgi:hypothetical protein